MSAQGTIALSAPIRFQVGARTLLTLPRRLVRLGWSLDEVLADRFKPLPSIGDADGYLLASVPETLVGQVDTQGFATHVRQRYVRHHVDLTIGHAAWLAGLSASARSALRRKTRRLAAGGAVDVRSYRTPAEIAAFHALARPLSALTYQERLLESGLPETPALLTLAAEVDAVRAWLLFHDGTPVAYLCCGAEGDTLRYDHVGHDPRVAGMSPGTVLQAEALGHLFADRFARFDFTEGEGQHKRRFATGGTACVDLILLRPTLANRAALAALAAFDGAMARLRRAARHGVAKRIGDRLRRA